MELLKVRAEVEMADPATCPKGRGFQKYGVLDVWSGMAHREKLPTKVCQENELVELPLDESKVKNISI